MKILTKEGKEINKIDLGTLEAGKTKTYTYVLLNDTKAEVQDIEISLANDEVKVKKQPKILAPGAQEEFTLEWSPSITVRKALQALITLSAKEVYRPDSAW